MKFQDSTFITLSQSEGKKREKQKEKPPVSGGFITTSERPYELSNLNSRIFC
jgi:hypothetical protein